MSSPAFDPAVCHRALRDVSPIYGRDWDRLDDRLVFYLQLVAETGSLLPGKHLVDLGLACPRLARSRALSGWRLR